MRRVRKELQHRPIRELACRTPFGIYQWLRTISFELLPASGPLDLAESPVWVFAGREPPRA
jgi:hypothetical protein